MSSHERQVLSILNDAGAVLARQRKHRIFRFRDGRIWVVPKTPSDVHAWRNNLSDLRRRLNLRTVAQ
jgi:predicted RNA binding protein YcfA (HicA-like mRNA interferase family)